MRQLLNFRMKYTDSKRHSYASLLARQEAGKDARLVCWERKLQH